MKQNWLFSVERVGRLNLIENQFIQVLVTNFDLRRSKGGVELRLRFREDSPAISTTSGKENVQSAILDFPKKAKSIQEQLEAVLLKGTSEKYEHRDDGFPFRFASGGTLPILRMNGRDFYCLFYRDIFPVGWNIANGGCCSRDELLDPRRTADRELREELIMVHRPKGIQYIFEEGESAVLSRFPGLDALETWGKIFPELMRRKIKRCEAPCKLYPGPDTAIIEIEGFGMNQIDECFLNINAEDFGIEVDRVAKVALPDGVSLCDGEQIAGGLFLNRLVGLFECSELERGVTAEEIREFKPSLFFFDGRLLEPSQLMPTVKNALPLKIRSERQRQYYELCEHKFDLCPVTRQILKRYALRKRAVHSDSAIKVFISYGGDDVRWAEKVYNHLTKTTNAFFFPRHCYEDTLSRTIDDALEQTQCIVVVGTSVDNINRDRCSYEWKRCCANQAFKPVTVVPFISGITPVDLPPELETHFAVEFLPESFEIDLHDKLIPKIPRSLRHAAGAGN